MWDANMKSDFLVMDRCKTEARQASTTRGRRISKVLNGDDNHAPANIMDNSDLACQSPSPLPLQLPVAGSEPVLPFELDHMYANCATERKEEGQQLKNLKDLLLLHLDLVKQQQGQLSARDQKITALRLENDSLRQRVEEANSRISTLEKSELRHRNCQHSKDGNSSYLDFGRQRKSNSLSGEWRCKRTSSADSPHFKHNSTQSSRSDAGGTQSTSKSSSKCRQPAARSSPSKQARESAKESVLQTDIMYYTPVGEALRGSDTWTSSFDQDEQVLVPTWRIRPVTSCYQMEGTENLDDDIFLKRHQKLEIDEKRRKRWDIQRLREQRLQEKLKRGRGGGSKETLGNRSPELNTFYPRVEEVEQVEVSEIIPVSAFGHSIPSIETEEFRVPWLS